MEHLALCWKSCLDCFVAGNEPATRRDLGAYNKNIQKLKRIMGE